MKRTIAVILFITALSFGSAYGQQAPETRDRTKEKLASLLEKAGGDINIAFALAKKQKFDYVGTLTTGLKNAESFEVIISVTDKGTIGFRIYPHYNKGYINLDKVKDQAALMRLLLRLSNRTFFFWGADDSGDVFAGYTFTLESGFPEEAIKVVLHSVVHNDKFVGEMRPFVDGTSANPAK